MTNKNQWWGYLHTQGTIQAKRYFGIRDIEEANESPFVQNVFGPFEASDRTEALTILSVYFKEKK